MGFFSFRTADTDESIPNMWSCRKTFRVRMVTEDGREWIEDAYDGYGDFGGKDIYELIAELNGKTTRDEGITLYFDEDMPAIYLPKLLCLDSSTWDNTPNVLNDCDEQGYFYDEMFDEI